MTKAEVEANEKQMFDRYLNDIKSNYPVERLNYFEENLEGTPSHFASPP